MSSSSSITPVRRPCSPERPDLRPNPGEVEHAFDVALADLLADGVFREERWDIPTVGDDRPVYFFELPDDLIWGATARILHELLALVVTERTAPPAPAPRREPGGTTPPGSCLISSRRRPMPSTMMPPVAVSSIDHAAR